MKVILLQDVQNLGKRGAIKEVSEGYARNFLFVKKLAEIATEAGLKKIDAIKKTQAIKEQSSLETTQELAEQLECMAITIAVKEKNGKLFGSVQAKDLLKELGKENIAIPEKSIILKDPIKEVGEYEIKIELEHNIEAVISVSVESAN